MPRAGAGDGIVTLPPVPVLVLLLAWMEVLLPLGRGVPSAGAGSGASPPFRLRYTVSRMLAPAARAGVAVLPPQNSTEFPGQALLQLERSEMAPVPASRVLAQKHVLWERRRVSLVFLFLHWVSPCKWCRGRGRLIDLRSNGACVLVAGAQTCALLERQCCISAGQVERVEHRAGGEAAQVQEASDGFRVV